MTATNIAIADAAFAAAFDRSRRAYLLQPAEISAYLAYLALKSLYGEPNSSDHDDEKTQWEYQLRMCDALIEVYDWKRTSWSIAIYTSQGAEQSGQTIANQFYQVVRKEAQRHSSREKAAVASPQGYVIQNPFSVYYEAADTLLEQTRKSDEAAPAESASDLENVIAIYLAKEDFCKAAFLMYLAAFEGLLNLIYELYLLPSLRDQRIQERLSREQIDIKVRLAPVYCSCFKGEAIDTDSETFRTFSRIVNLRNDFVHANFTKHMRSPVIEEDGHVFLIESGELEKHGLPTNFSTVKIEHVQQVKANIDAMVELLLAEMNPRYRTEFDHIGREQYIVVEMSDGEMIPKRNY